MEQRYIHTTGYLSGHDGGRTIDPGFAGFLKSGRLFDDIRSRIPLVFSLCPREMFRARCFLIR